MYDGSDQSVDCSISEQNIGRQCQVSEFCRFLSLILMNVQLTFSFDEDVDGPLYVYYELKNFYQNHRKYVNSRDPTQLGGTAQSKSALDSTCISDVTNGSMLLNPCGLIANSYFTGMSHDLCESLLNVTLQIPLFLIPPTERWMSPTLLGLLTRRSSSSLMASRRSS